MSSDSHSFEDQIIHSQLLADTVRSRAALSLLGVSGGLQVAVAIPNAEEANSLADLLPKAALPTARDEAVVDDEEAGKGAEEEALSATHGEEEDSQAEGLSAEEATSDALSDLTEDEEEQEEDGQEAEKARGADGAEDESSRGSLEARVLQKGQKAKRLQLPAKVFSMADDIWGESTLEEEWEGEEWNSEVAEDFMDETSDSEVPARGGSSAEEGKDGQDAADERLDRRQSSAAPSEEEAGGEESLDQKEEQQMRFLCQRRWSPWGVFCPVTLYEERRAVKGSKAFAVEFAGKIFLCADKEKQGRFIKDPRRYLESPPAGWLRASVLLWGAADAGASLQAQLLATSLKSRLVDVKAEFEKALQKLDLNREEERPPGRRSTSRPLRSPIGSPRAPPLQKAPSPRSQSPQSPASPRSQAGTSTPRSRGSSSGRGSEQTASLAVEQTSSKTAQTFSEAAPDEDETLLDDALSSAYELRPEEIQELQEGRSLGKRSPREKSAFPRSLLDALTRPFLHCALQESKQRLELSPTASGSPKTLNARRPWKSTKKTAQNLKRSAKIESVVRSHSLERLGCRPDSPQAVRISHLVSVGKVCFSQKYGDTSGEESGNLDSADSASSEDSNRQAQEEEAEEDEGGGEPSEASQTSSSSKEGTNSPQTPPPPKRPPSLLTPERSFVVLHGPPTKELIDALARVGIEFDHLINVDKNAQDVEEVAAAGAEEFAFTEVSVRIEGLDVQDKPADLQAEASRMEGEVDGSEEDFVDVVRNSSYGEAQMSDESPDKQILHHRHHRHSLRHLSLRQPTNK